jgi:hypothetical protein
MSLARPKRHDLIVDAFLDNRQGRQLATSTLGRATLAAFRIEFPIYM